MTGTKTSVMFLKKLKKIPDSYETFMAIAETCGHDRRGKEIPSDDILDIPKLYKDWEKKQK